MVAHELLLRGANPRGAHDPPLILKRTDQEFVPALLAELGAERGLPAVAERAISPRGSGAPVELLQPVQRTFNLALLELACDRYGLPRVDPQTVLSAGLVLRRHSVDAAGRPTPRLEGWRLLGSQLVGWLPFASAADEQLDPDVALRRPTLRSGNAEVDRQLALLNPAQAPWAERVSPLFVAPPAVCQATARTLLYGVIPVTSGERTEAPPSLPPFSAADLRDHLPPFLRANVPPPTPLAGSVLRQNAADSTDPSLRSFILNLRQLRQELDAFGERAAANDLRPLLDGIVLDINTGDAQPLGAFLAQASRVLVDRDGRGQPAAEQPSVRMPRIWPALDAGRAEQVLARVTAQLTERLQAFSAGQGRFDDLRRQYCIRAFARVQHDPDCPPELVWSPYSEPFTIAPWYASGDAPPVQIALPDILAPDALRQLKPNVAFQVPRQLFNFMQQNDPKKLLDGEGSSNPSGFVFDWICAFNIPIITLCAFIVLNIFLSLFDLIFQWMLWVKLCIPVPRRPQ